VARCIEEARIESGTFLVGLAAKHRSVIGLSEQSGASLQHAQVLVVDGRGCHARRCELGDARLVGADVVPVAEPIGDDSLVGARAQIGRVEPHDIVLRGQKAEVAIALVDIPWRQYGRASPFRRIVEDAPLRLEEHILRRDLRNPAHLIRRRGGGHISGLGALHLLGVGDVARRRGIEPGEIEIVKHGRREQMRLLKPAKLFAVRAIRKEAH